MLCVEVSNPIAVEECMHACVSKHILDIGIYKR